MDECASFDNMVNMVYEPPEGLSAMEDAVFFVDPGAHDAEKVAANIFDTYNPKWDILPRGPSDKDNAEKLERWLEWQMAMTNLHGETEPSRIAMTHSLRYNRICAQMDYLPYWLPKDKKKWTKEQKQMMKGGPYCIILHKPHCVHYEMGKYGLRWVASVALVPAGEVLDHWEGYANKTTDEGKKIAKAVKQVQDILDDDPEAEVVLVDYTSIDKRYVACWVAETIEFDILDEKDDRDLIEFVDGDNPLEFINWVISVGSSDALLTTLHRGHLWQNTNDAESIKRTAAYRLAFQPAYLEEGVGEDVEADFTGTQVGMKVPAGKKVTWLIPRQLDPAFNELSAQDRTLMNSSTSIQQISNVSNSSNVQYATADLFMQISLTQLESYKRTFEKAWKELGILCFQWLKQADATEIGYRRADKGKPLARGEQIVVGPNDFVQDELFIECKLIANTPTNKMQLVNMAVQMKQAGLQVPDEEHIEKLGFGNPEALQERWFEEQTTLLAFQMFTEEQKAALQMMIAQKQAEMQMQMQNAALEASGQANPDQGQPVIPGGEGANTNNGGMPGVMSAPIGRKALEQ